MLGMMIVALGILSIIGEIGTFVMIHKNHNKTSKIFEAIWLASWVVLIVMNYLF